MADLHSDNDDPRPRSPSSGSGKRRRIESDAGAAAPPAPAAGGAGIPSIDAIVDAATQPVANDLYRQMLSKDCILAFDVSSTAVSGSHLLVRFRSGARSAVLYFVSPLNAARPVSTVTSIDCSIVHCDEEFFSTLPPFPEDEGSHSSMFYRNGDENIVFLHALSEKNGATFPATQGSCVIEFIRGRDDFVLHNPTPRGHLQYSISSAGVTFNDMIIVDFIEDKFASQENQYALPSEDIAVVRQFLDGTEGEKFEFSVQVQDRDGETRALIRFRDESERSAFVVRLRTKEDSTKRPVFPSDWDDGERPIVKCKMMKATFKEGVNVRADYINLVTGMVDEGAFLITDAKTSMGSRRKAMCSFCEE